MLSRRVGNRKGSLTLEVIRIGDCTCAVTGASRVRISCIAKISTEGRIDDERVLGEVLVDVAIVIEQTQDWFTPSF
jgi:hypothetical protein